MSINTKTKGNNNQRIFAEFLRTVGWNGQKYETEVVRNTKFHHGDYFGICDIIGKNAESWIVVQVKSNSPKSANKEMANSVFPPGTIKLVAVRYDGHAGKPVRWRIKNICTGEVVNILEREM